MKKILILATLIALTSPMTICAQVTIGSALNPSPGAILDLKENSNYGANSTRGLVLPRVKLTAKNELFPMFKEDPNYTSIVKDEQDALHIGLLVYNLNQCDGFGKGVYQWEGKSWVPLLGVKAGISPPDLTSTYPATEKIDDNTLLVHLPSGLDIRTSPSDKKFSLPINWSDATKGSMNRTAVAASAFGGLNFVNPDDHPTSWTPNPATISPVTFNFHLNDMSDIITSRNANISDPFKSRETILTFELPGNECYSEKAVQVRMNQTNYRLVVSRYSGELQEFGYRFRNSTSLNPSGADYYRFLSTPNNEIEVYSNLVWNRTYSTTTTGIVDEINIPVSDGKNTIDGTYPFAKTYFPTYNVNIDGTRGKEIGVINFTDAASTARMYPVEVHLVQCRSGDFDAPENAPNDPSMWSDRALRHTDEQGKPFYSAYFGSAGRWMTTNLATTAYSAGSNGTKELKPYVDISTELQDSGNPKYAYPQKGAVNFDPGTVLDWGATPTDWRWEEGLLYNWYAASGRNYNATDNTDEANTTPNQPIQGICPNGWHLPSDEEWHELEKEIYENIDKYGMYDMTDITVWNTHISSTTPVGWNPSWNTDIWFRGNPIGDNHLGHGAAMKEICPILDGNFFAYQIGSLNYSKEPKSGGFSAIMVGRITGKEDGISPDIMYQQHRGWDTNFWSSSQFSADDAWERALAIRNGGVSRRSIYKTRLQSVRCKKSSL